MTLSATPTLPTQTELNDFAKVLRQGATIIGAIALSGEPQTIHLAGGSCWAVIWAGDDHTIYKTEICEISPDHYEVGADVPVGAW